MASRDEELIDSYRKCGSRTALDELLRRHIAKIRGLIFPMVLNDATADDLTQEVFLKAIRGLPSFDGRASFSTWLFRIAMNTSHSYLTRNGRAPVTYRASVPEPATDASRPERVAIHSELAKEIETALGELSPKLRAAIVLTCLQEKSASEAASIEGCQVATMYWRIHEARKQLNERLARYLS